MKDGTNVRVAHFQRPDYETLRDQTEFTWYVGSTVYALLELTETPLGMYNLNPDVCIEVYRQGRELFREIYPNEEDVPMPTLYTPPVSYGHVNGLGSELLFPDEGEVAHTHIYASLEEGIAALEKPVDFATAGMAPFFLDYQRQLRQAFPDEPVGFSYGLEGPLTTAYELRGEGFFYDIMDKPELAKQFLELTTRSIVEFSGFLAKVNDTAMIDPAGTGMCDDLSSMVPPQMFEELVVPYWEQYYLGHTTGKRHAHIEDLRPAQLQCLEHIGLSSYDPSISPQLNPKIIYGQCRVPFQWRLGSFHYLTMTCQDVRDWVFEAVADGASGVHTFIEAILCRPENVAKVNTFIDTGKEVKSMLDAGAGREEIGNCVSAAGKAKFWDHWPE